MHLVKEHILLIDGVPIGAQHRVQFVIAAIFRRTATSGVAVKNCPIVQFLIAAIFGHY